ncbi:MAG: hypothetical protein Q8K32_20400 [Archangium sp.]|nr:hypothetical protein [Archangium sp.]
MFRSPVFLVAVLCSACGPLVAPRPDGGSGGGGGSLLGGGTGGSGGGTGGGSLGGGTGGGSLGGGTGGGSLGGGTGGGSTGGGGGATGGGSGGGATGGGGGQVGPLSWASITLTGATSSSYIIGISGSATDLWAVQDTGYLFHSTGGAFTLQTPIQYGAKALYASGGTVVIIQTRSLRTCTANCTTEAAFANFDLLGGAFNLFGEAVCGLGPNDITAIVSGTDSMAQVFHWDGTAWTRTNANLGVRYPRACWFDAAGSLNVVGEGAVARSEMGATTIQPLASAATVYYGGADVGGTSWVVGPSHYVARRSGSTWTPFTVSTTSTLHVVGGPSENEVYALGYFASSVGNGFKWNGTTLAPLGNILPNTGTQSMIRSMVVTGPNELYLGGSNTSGPIIIRGRR